jgi:hypothetical protein
MEAREDGWFDGNAEWEVNASLYVNPPGTEHDYDFGNYSVFEFEDGSVKDGDFFAFDDELVISKEVPVGTVLSLHAAGLELDTPKQASDELPELTHRITLDSEMHGPVSTFAEGGWDVGPLWSSRTDFAYIAEWDVHFWM